MIITNTLDGSNNLELSLSLYELPLLVEYFDNYDYSTRTKIDITENGYDRTGYYLIEISFDDTVEKLRCLNFIQSLPKDICSFNGNPIANDYWIHEDAITC